MIYSFTTALLNILVPNIVHVAHNVFIFPP